MTAIERTGRRDLGFSRWHRTHLGADCSASDVDLMGYCATCLAPLYVIESTRADWHPAHVVMDLADRLGVPGFLVYYANDESGVASSVRAYGRVAADGRRHLIAADGDFATELTRLRRLHRCEGISS